MADAPHRSDHRPTLHYKPIPRMPIYCALIGVIAFITVAALKLGQQTSQKPSLEDHKYTVLTTITVIAVLVMSILNTRRRAEL